MQLLLKAMMTYSGREFKQYFGSAASLPTRAKAPIFKLQLYLGAARYSRAPALWLAMRDLKGARFPSGLCDLPVFLSSRIANTIS